MVIEMGCLIVYVVVTGEVEGQGGWFWPGGWLILVTGQEQVARTVYQKNVSQFYANGSPGTHAEGVFGQGD